MEDIKSVVDRIVDSCANDGVKVEKTLAAFVARTVVLEDAVEFHLDKEMTEDDVKSLVERSVKRIELEDCPQMETLRMQVDFDQVFSETEESLESDEAAKVSRRNTLKTAIVNSESSKAADFETINAVYRQVFNFLLTCAGADTAKDQAVEREVAAALESVFPKIGLKAFLAMEKDDQLLQLTELASIVMGIRLFNRRIGKGGAGIPDAVGQARKTAQSLINLIREEKRFAESMVEDYSRTLVYIHLNKSSVSTPEEIVLERWKHELNNRRQFVSFLSSLETDALQTIQSLTKFEDEMEAIMRTLEELVGSRNSVPKDQVYPKFDAAAEVWSNIERELELISSRQIVLATLSRYRESCTFTLDQALNEQSLVNEQRNSNASKSMRDDHVARYREKDEEKTSAREEESKDAESKIEVLGEGKHGEGKGQDEEFPVRIMPGESPDFMNYPLQYQGYCPWSIAARNGLLLPGDPSLGVVRYEGRYQIFSSEQAVSEFMERPQEIVQELVGTARGYPELIHLLQLERYFPEVALGNQRTSRSGTRASGHSQLQRPMMIDASTETPTHFIEKHIDPSYEWNEWALRRRALQVVNLKNVRTSSSQTTKSHFRRENETQVYLPRQNATQTGISKGTNPPRTFQYITGLRGVQSSSFARYGNGKPLPKSSTSSTVLQLTLE